MTTGPTKQWCSGGGKLLEPFYIAWRKCIRRVWKIPYTSHDVLIPYIHNTLACLHAYMLTCSASDFIHFLVSSIRSLKDAKVGANTVASLRLFQLSTSTRYEK